MEHGSRTRLVTTLVLAAVFGSGVLLGFAADSSLGAAPADTIAGGAGGETDPEEPRQRTRLYDRVDPSETQSMQIDSIVKLHRVRANSLDEKVRAEYRDGFRVILLETRSAIKGVLTTQQAEEYQRLLDEWDARPVSERGNRDDRD